MSLAVCSILTLQALQEMVKGSFVFYQVQDSVDDGLALQTNYRVQELPCIMIIDPITGATNPQAWGDEALFQVHTSCHCMVASI